MNYIRTCTGWRIITEPVVVKEDLLAVMKRKARAVKWLKAKCRR